MKFNLENIRLLFKFRKYVNLTFSQEGEDVLLSKYVDFQREGIYVDIGAHHPMRFSNTCRLYLNGWHGINVDAMPGAMDLFCKYRKRDINISCGIGEKECMMEFFIFDEPALNTFDKELAESRIQAGSTLLEKKEVPMRRLENIFSENLQQEQKIDILTLDIEGFELAALKSNNWEVWRPKLILCESLFRGDLHEFFGTDTVSYLQEKNYTVKSILDNTIVFCDNNSWG